MRRGPKPTGYGQYGLTAQILSVLTAMPGSGFSAKQVATNLRAPEKTKTISMLLARLAKGGQAVRVAPGIYSNTMVIKPTLFDLEIYTA